MIATSQFTISVIKDGKDGAPGATGPQGTSVLKVVEEYRLSDSNTELTGSGTGYTWSETKPSIPAGKYLWIRERTDLSNNTSTYGTAHCDVVISGLVFDVDRNSNAITSKVWESDITTKINEYDGSTGKSIRDRVTKTETDISGINTTISDIQTDVAGKADGSTVTTLTTKVNTISDTVDGHTQTIQSNTSRIDDAEDEIESTKTVANQTADKFTWLVDSGTSASNFTLTSRVAELISPQVVIKDPAGSATIITGGKIQANSITTNMLKSDAIKSTNYTASSNASSPYSATGAFLDLNTGSLYMPNFGVNGTTGAAYFNGTVNANAGKFGDDTSYWNIETVYDYNMQPHAALVGTGSPYLQTGNWQVSDNAVATRKYTSTDESTGNATYYKDSTSNTFYDVGMKIPTNFGGYSASDSSVTRYNKAFYYGRKYTGNSVPSLDSDWTYFFEIDSGGNIITAGDVYEGGVKLSEKYAAITDVGSAYLPKTGGTITGDLTVNGKLDAKGTVTTTLMLQTNLGSTSAAQLTGSASAIIKPGITGTLGVGNGGTGKTTAVDAANAFITALPNWTATPTDNTYFIRRDTGGAASYGKVKFSTLWTYINNKITSEYDITNTYRRLDDNQFDTIDITDAQIGNLMVTEAGRFTNGLYGDLTGNADTATTATTANKVANSLQILLNSGSTEGTNKFTYDGSSPKNINITKSSIGLGSVENTALSTWAGSSNLTTTKVGTLAAAATKGVDTSISAGSTSTNLPTSKAVAAFVSANNGVTSITLTAGGGISLNSSDAITSTGTRTITNTGVRSISESTTNGKISVNTGGTTADVAIHGLGSWAYKSSATASDVGLNAGQLVKSLASNNDGKLVLTYFDDTTSDPIEVKIVGQSGSSVSYADALNVNGSAIGGSEQPVYINNQGEPTTTNKIPKLNNTTTGGAFYAPTSVGTSGQILKSNGSGAPTWINQSSIAAGTAAKLTSGTVGSWSVPVYFSDGVPTSITYLNNHPENNTSVLLPFINNDLAHLVQRGGSYEIYSTTSTSFTAININKTALSLDLSEAFDGSYSYCNINRPQNETTVIDIVYPGIFDYTNRFYIDFGSDGWRAKNIQLLVCNSDTETSYVLKNSITDNNLGHWTCKISHTSTNSSGGTVQGFNRLRIVLSGWVSTQNRIAQIGVIKYSSIGTRIPYMSRGIDDQVYRSITPAKNNTYSLGSSTNNWSNVYATTFYGALSGNASSATKATQDGDGAVISSTYLKRSGGIITGQLKINGVDLILGATGTGNSPNDSGDLVWQYGNGTEKMRLYSSDTYTEKHGIAFRQYDENQNQLYNGKIPLADGTDASGTWGISITGSATKATQDSDGNAINTTYMKKSGGTFTGDVTGTGFSASSYVAVNSSSSGTAGGLALYNTTPTAYGIAMRSTSNGGYHGFVQSTWATYFYMKTTASDIGTRGWIFKSGTSDELSPVASISTGGHAVFNGSVTVGGNTTNTSGMRMEYDTTLQCTNFVFN